MKIRSAFALQVIAALVPSLLLFFVVPVIRRNLGLDAFASFTVLVSSISVLSQLDGGLGRGTTYFISRDEERRRSGGEAESWLWPSLLLGVGFSLLIALIGMIALSMGGGYFRSAAAALQVLLYFSPAFVLGSVLKGALEGQRRFGLSTGLQIAYSCAFSVAPLLLLSAGSQLASFSWGVGIIRVALIVALAAATWRLLAGDRGVLTSTLSSQAARIFSYIKWLIVSNVMGLTIVFADRFVIARYFDGHTVAAYILPMEMITRVQLFGAAFCSVIFPTLVAHAERKKSESFQAISSAQGVVAAAVLVAGCIGVPIAEPIFSWWLGPQLGSQAAQIALVSLISVGTTANTQLALVAINSLGHTRQIAFLHAFEIVTYAGLLALAVSRTSLPLLLFAWLTRHLIDVVFMTRILHGIAGHGSLDATHGRLTSRWLWTGLIALYIGYVGIVVKLPLLGFNKRAGLAVVSAAIALSVLASFFYRLQADVSRMRRSAST